MRHLGRLPGLGLMPRSVSLLFLASLCVPAESQTPIPEISVGPATLNSPTATRAATTADLTFAFSRLHPDQKRSLGPLTPSERTRLTSTEIEGQRASRAKIGLSREIEPSIRLAIDLGRLKNLPAEQTLSGGLLRIGSDGRVSWTTGVRSEGAVGLRFYFSMVRLPTGSRVYVYSAAGEVHGPYQFDAGFPVEGFWTHAVFAEEAFIEVQFGELGMGTFEFDVPRIAHLTQLPTVVRPLAVRSDSCLIDATCASTTDFPAIGSVSLAVGQLTYQEAGVSYLCTGSLLNDTISSLSPYLLTAHHCFGDQAAATSLEVFWRYRTATCDGAFPNENQFPTTLGSTLLATGTASDFTFVRLSENPPGGSTLLGWNSADYSTADNVGVYRISHPAPAGTPLPQAFSKHSIRQFPSATCPTLPQGNFIYSSYVAGGTAGGSSGSALCLSDGTVIGQLNGICGSALTDDCDPTNLRVDGAFRTTYPSIAQWLNPTISSAPVAAFTYAPTTPQLNQSIAFTDQSSGSPTSWAWSFGDGTVSSSQSPSKTYAAAGVFTVSLTVANSAGSSSTSHSVTVTAGGNSGGCTPGINTLCLNGGRFKVTATYQTSTASGAGNGVAMTTDTGYFWFFSSNNVEMVVKVVNGCTFNSRYWVFAGGLTNVSVNFVVTDTRTGVVKTYSNPANTAFQPIQDTAAIATCP